MCLLPFPGSVCSLGNQEAASGFFAASAQVNPSLVPWLFVIVTVTSYYSSREELVSKWEACRVVKQIASAKLPHIASRSLSDTAMASEVINNPNYADFP